MALVDPEQAELQPPPRRCRVAHAWITDELYGQLELEAQRQRCHPDELVARLLECTLDGGLVDLVLAQ